MSRPALHRTAAELLAEPWTARITPADAGWDHTSLRILDLAPGATHRFATEGDETLVLPLSGSATVECEGHTFDLEGRNDVFTTVSDFAYVPRDATVTITSPGGGRFALPAARAHRRLEPRYGPAADVPVELRGAGNCSRQVVNFCTPEAFPADSLIACEVITPAGNWSSFPPHKHDEERPGQETALEEIYYFVVADGPAGPGVAYQRVYGTADRPIDVLAEVRTGDVVLIPHGWHGPSMAVPGYDLYFLNAMAGPGAERAWRICDDPAHAWIRGTWEEQPVDPRLPMSRASGASGAAGSGARSGPLTRPPSKVLREHPTPPHAEPPSKVLREDANPPHPGAPSSGSLTRPPSGVVREDAAPPGAGAGSPERPDAEGGSAS